MKKIAVFLLILLGILPLLLCCTRQEAMHFGSDAEILEIDLQNGTLKVRCLEKSIKDTVVMVDCRSAAEGHQILYVEYETDQIEDISLADLQVGDTVALGMQEDAYQQLKNRQLTNGIEAYSVQLLTQRLRLAKAE